MFRIFERWKLEIGISARNTARHLAKEAAEKAADEIVEHEMGKDEEYPPPTPSPKPRHSSDPPTEPEKPETATVVRITSKKPSLLHSFKAYCLSVACCGCRNIEKQIAAQVEVKPAKEHVKPG
jgi:hypothetical protein